jgi:cytochrome b
MAYVAAAWVAFLAWALWGSATARGEKWPVGTAIVTGIFLLLLALSVS